LYVYLKGGIFGFGVKTVGGLKRHPTLPLPCVNQALWSFEEALRAGPLARFPLAFVHAPEEEEADVVVIACMHIAIK
jgi:hypothetical protein